MKALSGIYQNGTITFEEEYTANSPVKVIVTFLEETKSESSKFLKLEDFSFAECQEILKDFKGSLSDTVIEERRSEL